MRVDWQDAPNRALANARPHERGCIMRKRIVGLLTCAVCAFALCLGLAGCGGSKGANKDQFVGYWECVTGTADGETLAEEDLDYFRELGFNIVLHLAEDGTGECDILGDITETAWDAEKSTMEFDGQTVDIKIEDGNLKLSDGSSIDMTFRKGDQDKLAKQIEDDRSGANNLLNSIDDDEDAAADDSDFADAVAFSPEVVVADDEYLTITITEKGVDKWGDVGYTVHLVNNSDKNIFVYADSTRNAVDGTMMSPFLGVTLMGHTNATEFMSYSDLSSVDELKNATVTIAAQDDDEFVQYGTYQVTVP